MIYHITERAEWANAKIEGQYKAESLTIEGFIHCCTEEQFPQVSNFYFKGRADLIVLEIDDEKLAKNLKWEVVGEHTFPHIYAPLDIHLVMRTADLKPNTEGIFEFPFVKLLH